MIKTTFSLEKVVFVLTYYDCLSEIARLLKKHSVTYSTIRKKKFTLIIESAIMF